MQMLGFGPRTFGVGLTQTQNTDRATLSLPLDISKIQRNPKTQILWEHRGRRCDFNHQMMDGMRSLWPINPGHCRAASMFSSSEESRPGLTPTHRLTRRPPPHHRHERGTPSPSSSQPGERDRQPTPGPDHQEGALGQPSISTLQGLEICRNAAACISVGGACCQSSALNKTILFLM